MRSILFGILALLALIVVSALGAQFFVPPNSAGSNQISFCQARMRRVVAKARDLFRRPQ
jgi:hypothetical protein